MAQGPLSIEVVLNSNNIWHVMGGDKMRMERKFREEAINRIENKYCHVCKRRMEKIVGNWDCMKVHTKFNHKRLSKVRCGRFKRIGLNNVTTQ